MRSPLILAVAFGMLAACGSGRTTGTPSDANLISQDDIDRRDTQRIEDMLRGQVSGVEVYETPSGLAVRIRGGSGFRESPPLYVIDGLPIEQGADGALTGLNPSDVASIRVLKSVSETAAYGSRGANGVVLITTIRPPAPSETEGT